MATNAVTTVPYRKRVQIDITTATDVVIPESSRYRSILIQFTSLAANVKAQVAVGPGVAPADLSTLGDSHYSGDLTGDGLMIIDLPLAVPGGINLNFASNPTGTVAWAIMSNTPHNMTRR